MTTRSTILFAALAAPASLLLVAATAQPPPAKPAKAAPGATTLDRAAQAGFARDVLPVVQKYCVGCHSGEKPAGGLALNGYKDANAVLKARNKWEQVARNVREGTMPPAGMPAPAPAEKEALVSWIDSTLSKADCQLNDPGRVTMRRLNREEYNNTLRDLFGVNLRLADDFPADDVGYGFDNIGDVLSISPLLMEKYIRAAEKAARAVILAPETAPPTAKRLDGDRLKDGGGASPHDRGFLLYSVGEVYVDYPFPRPGEYTLRARAWGHQAGPEPAKMEFRVDGKGVSTVEVRATENKPDLYEIAVRVEKPGTKRVALAFLNDYYNPQASDPNDRDRNLGIDYLEIEGPRGASAELPASHRRLLPPKPANLSQDAYARQVLSAFARRAYRRPVTQADVDRLMRAYKLARKEGDSFERGIQLGIQAALISPHFLFRVELDKDPNNPKAKRLVNDYELASRLSYFLWSSMPDEELFALAAQKKLQDPKVLAAQARRMMKDPKARALAENFAGQWLQLKKLEQAAPDKDLFPVWNENLRAAMRDETLLFFETIVKEDRSVLEFLDAKFTFVNEALAKLYGIPNVQGEKLQRVTLADDRRGGLLTQASILTLTSNPTRTSPVKRGKWVLEQLLGTPPPPPPPNVPELPEDKKGPLTGTLREKMEQHRKNPACASCHARMDPLGFGLENFDAVGAWRDKEGSFAIDASGVLPNGQKFNGPAQLKGILKARKADYVRSLSDKLLTYALGRGLEPTDRCHVDEIATAVMKNEYRFSALVAAVVTSDPFRMRRGDGGLK